MEKLDVAFAYLDNVISWINWMLKIMISVIMWTIEAILWLIQLPFKMIMWSWELFKWLLFGAPSWVMCCELVVLVGIVYIVWRYW